MQNKQWYGHDACVTSSPINQVQQGVEDRLRSMIDRLNQSLDFLASARNRVAGPGPDNSSEAIRQSYSPVDDALSTLERQVDQVDADARRINSAI